MKSYYTPQDQTEGFYKEKGSKFISLVFPIASKEEIKLRLDEVKKQYHDARHHCYAWILGLSNIESRINDDGEPSHSAGDPIMGQIQSFELSNTLIVVVRYFGGVKLGVGGLIHAYREASYDALKKIERRQIFEYQTVALIFPYEVISSVERIIGEFEIEKVQRDFAADCKVSGLLKKDYVDNFRKVIETIYQIKLKYD